MPIEVDAKINTAEIEETMAKAERLVCLLKEANSLVDELAQSKIHHLFVKVKEAKEGGCV